MLIYSTVIFDNDQTSCNEFVEINDASLLVTVVHMNNVLFQLRPNKNGVLITSISSKLKGDNFIFDPGRRHMVVSKESKKRESWKVIRNVLIQAFWVFVSVVFFYLSTQFKVFKQFFQFLKIINHKKEKNIQL